MAAEPVVARLAATVMLLRDGPQGLEVFMVVRHDAIDFAAGALVFPGGRVDAPDFALAARADRCPDCAGLEPLAGAIRVASIRETFEECGLLLARRRGADRLVSGEELAPIAARHRVALTNGDITLADVVDAEDLVLATDALVPFAHWITPPIRPKRYDTYFFLAVAPTDHAPEHDGHESVDSVWIAPAEAMAGVKTGRYKLVFPTFMNLLKLGRFPTVDAALTETRASPVVTVAPIPVEHGDGTRSMRIPLEAGYGGEEFASDLPPAAG